MAPYSGPDRRTEVDHRWFCWEEPEGPGSLLRREVSEMKKRMWMWQGAILLVAALGPTVLGVWLSFRLASSERAASRRDESAVHFRTGQREEFDYPRAGEYVGKHIVKDTPTGAQ